MGEKVGFVKNLKVVVSAVALVMFFVGVTGIIRKLSPKSDSYLYYLVLICLAMFYFWIGDGSLTELLGDHYPMIIASGPMDGAAGGIGGIGGKGGIGGIGGKAGIGV